ncbi:beta-N-acetylhexosaminidase [Alkalihalobacillus sp. EGI L200015]|nr:beta-N-acetylhexosaminidase [Pseudalkalibacillus salsuginis]
MTHSDIKAGETHVDVVKGKFKSPDEQETITQGTYLTYHNQDLSFGYRTDGIIFDVRSYLPELLQIKYDTIIEMLGNPDHVRYYSDDEEHDQIILVYDLNKTYQLKLILPRPDENEPNPSLHHTSVYTEFKKDTEEELDVNRTVNDRLNEMTLNEKIGQMIIAGFSGTGYNDEINDLLQQYKIGGFIFYQENMTTPQQTVELLNTIKELNDRNPLPVLLGIDQEGGRISRLPGNLEKIPTSKEIGEKDNAKLSYEIGKILADEVKSFGFNLNFAPVLDINSNPDNPIIGDRSFGSEPSIVSRIGVQMMKGMQSENVIPVIKHFPGHGDTDVDSHLELPVVNKSQEELNSFELKPFIDAFQEDSDVVMIAHILLSQLDPHYPSSLSEEIVANILRDDLKFDGVIMTDDMTMNAIENNFNLQDASVRAIQAGNDIIMVAHNYNKVIAVYEAIETAVRNGEISEERINRSVERIIRLKRKYNLDDRHIPYVDIQKLNKKINNALKQF